MSEDAPMRLRTIIATALLLLLSSAAQAALDDLLGKYATTQDYCKKPEMRVFEIRRGIVEGPNFLCILGAPKQAGAGQDAYEAKCTQGDRVRIGVLAIDRSAKDRIKILLPESKDWISLFRCK
jgi:hypothetical protein